MAGTRMDIKVHVYIYIVTIVCVHTSGDPLLPDTPKCVVPVPCTCTAIEIDCVGKHLTSIPDITAQYPYNSSMTLYLHFSDNLLVNIPSNVFPNVGSPSLRRVELYLRNNRITTLSDLAFNGIENETTVLHLENNSLTVIPSAIGHLANLQILNLAGNPILSIDSRALSPFSDTLLEFCISVGNMSSWPAEINALSELRSLSLDHIPFLSLPQVAFHGLETNLRSLSLTQTNLDRIPGSLCHFKHLQTFIFSNNQRLPGDNLSLENLCQNPMTEVSELHLDENNISNFPSGLFTVFPNLTHLQLAGNKLITLPMDYIPERNQVTSLNLNSNWFTEIPFAIRYFRRLRFLYMKNNNLYQILPVDMTGQFILYVCCNCL